MAMGSVDGNGRWASPRRPGNASAAERSRPMPGLASGAGLENLAITLDNEWKSRGVRVFQVQLHELRTGTNLSFNNDYLRRWGSRSIPPDRRQGIEDNAELMYVDRDHKWTRPSVIAPEDRKFVSSELGRLFLETRVSSVLSQIGKVSPSHIR
jgi:hypothetical protein